jgi:hypothetical protein
VTETKNSTGESNDEGPDAKYQGTGTQGRLITSTSQIQEHRPIDLGNGQDVEAAGMDPSTPRPASNQDTEDISKEGLSKHTRDGDPKGRPEDEPEKTCEPVIFLSIHTFRHESRARSGDVGVDDHATMKNLRDSYSALRGYSWWKFWKLKQPKGIKFYRVRHYASSLGLRVTYIFSSRALFIGAIDATKLP